MSKIIVRTDLGVNPHDYLDYKLKYEQYLKPLKAIFNGYVSQYHFLKLFDANERTLKEEVKKLVENNWLGVSPLGKYNMLYFKRKSTICLSENSRNGDLKPPTMYQTLRSLMLSEVILETFVNNAFDNILSDVFILNEVLDEDDNELINVAILDITKRGKLEYKKLLEDVLNISKLEGKKINIKIYSFGDRYKLLEKRLDKEFIEDILGGKLLLDKVSIACSNLDILKFFGNKEPLL